MTDSLTRLTTDLHGVLTHGLLQGYWSINQFNARLAPGQKPVLPNWAFLDAHPQFTDPGYRDLAAFTSARRDGFRI